MNEILIGHITDIGPNFGIRAEASYDNWERFALRKYEQVQIVLTDSRLITPKQRNAIFATVHDIAEFCDGYAYKTSVREKVLAELQVQYLMDLTDSEELRYWLTWNYCKLTETPFFSLSPLSPACVDVTTARDFLGWLIDLCVEHGIPCSDRLIARAEDIERYLYACIKYKRCAICGKKADLHHVDTVGMGRNRREISHIGMRAESLCRKHHEEAHQKGQCSFDGLYHINGIPMDKTLCEAHRLKAEGI
ncbi:MAG TPA: putative HNHc nuclease [Candidatus Limiplasma sp.]|nr:putative HNHc nuclease [Candidatus Limiplasma sp.]